MINKKIAVFALFYGFFTGMLPAQNKPAWVDRPSAVYPDNLFVSAVGGGQDRAAAENSAKASLVSYFKQSVSSRISIQDRVKQVGETVQSSSDMSLSIEAESTLDTLIGVEIRETWNDKRGKTGWWAVAVLEKRRGRELYSAEFNKVINEITLLSAVSGEISLVTITKCRNAKALLNKADAISLVLSMLDGPDRHNELIRLSSQVEQTMNQAANLSVDVSVTGDISGRFKTVFTTALAKQEIRIGSQNSRFVLEVKINLENAPQGQYFNSRYTIEAVLKDTQTNAELLTYNISGREGHIASQADADNRAILIALRKIEEGFPVMLAEFLGA